MSTIHVVDHPLVQHKLTLMRQIECSTKDFRQLLNEIAMLMTYEVTRDLPTEDVESEDVPKELLDICAELGIPKEKVNIVLRMTEEGSDEKAGV